MAQILFIKIMTYLSMFLITYNFYISLNFYQSKSFNQQFFTTIKNYLFCVNAASLVRCECVNYDYKGEWVIIVFVLTYSYFGCLFLLLTWVFFLFVFIISIQICLFVFNFSYFNHAWLAAVNVQQGWCECCLCVGGS